VSKTKIFKIGHGIRIRKKHVFNNAACYLWRMNTFNSMAVSIHGTRYE